MNIVAEIGINHNGLIQRAKDMIKHLAGSHVTHIKFQKFTPELFVSPEKFNLPHPNPVNSFGKTYGEHKRKLDLSKKEHIELKSFVEYNGMKYACSVCDDRALAEIIEVKPDYIKVPSALNHDLRFINKIATTWDGMIHISLGMTSKDEVERLMAYCIKFMDRVVFYDCTSDYTGNGPIYMSNKYTTIKGYSCHYPDPAFGIVAASRGAEWIEYHTTFDRESKGTDHKISLTTHEMKSLGRSIALLSKIQARPEDVPINERADRERLKP